MTSHVSVLLKELIDSLQLKPGCTAIDCTTGAGGHTERLLEVVGPKGLVIGLDRDESALALARERLRDSLASGCAKLLKAPFSEVALVCEKLNLLGQVDGIIADIGVSSMHLDQAQRGFSFMHDGPLDMRMDQSQAMDAAEIVNTWDEKDLAKLFFELGEEPKSRHIAKAIVQRRGEKSLATTAELAELVKRAARYPSHSKKHPATKVFQALRITVNDELGELKAMVKGGFKALKPGGRLAIICFHSLEDRIVKHLFLDLTARRERSEMPRGIPFTEEQMLKLHRPTGLVIKPFPLVPSDEEIARNPRARSAKLRVIEKIADPI